MPNLLPRKDDSDRTYVRNRFGHTARGIGDRYAGTKWSTALGGDWRKLRKTPHTHHPVDDALGVAEALVGMKGMGLRAPF